MLVTLILDGSTSADRQLPPRLATALLERIPGASSVAVSWHAGRVPQLLGAMPIHAAGEREVPDIATPDVFVHAVAGAFVQAHREQASTLYVRVADAIGERLGGLAGKRVLELFAGAGAIGLQLAARGARVELIESVAVASDAARRAAERQRLEVRVRATDADDAIDAYRAEGATFDAVILDPPRRGVTPHLRATVARIRPAVIAYVSCEPETLARDLDHFARLGYRASTVEPFDFMPQTHEVESFVLLERGALPPAVPVEADGDAWWFAKAGYESVSGALDANTNLVQRAERHLGRALVPVLSPDPDQSGLCLLVADEGAAKGWKQRLADGGECDVVALVRGITRPKGSVRRSLRSGGGTTRLERRGVVTRYRRIAVVSGHSLVRATVQCWEAQQVLQHLAGIAHPVLGDPRFGDARSNRHVAERFGLDRPFVHLERVRCSRPEPGIMVDVAAPLPGDLASVLRRMGATTEVMSHIGTRTNGRRSG